MNRIEISVDFYDENDDVRTAHFDSGKEMVTSGGQLRPRELALLNEFVRAIKATDSYHAIGASEKLDTEKREMMARYLVGLGYTPPRPDSEGTS